jgi:phosphatidylserine/phosphatidylglycerophosphate/cardiolipin synthase-like enzyme
MKRLPLIAPGPVEPVELVLDGDHFTRVVEHGILEAKRSLAIMTADFKATLVPTGARRGARSIVEVLARLARRGVETRLLHAGVPSAPTLEELKRHRSPRLAIRRCPRVHTKIVVVDCRAMYLGSANVTGAGIGAKAAGRRNFEAGIWTRSEAMIDAMLQRFDALWEGAECEGCGRREVCPVPLEEPFAAREEA